MILNSSWIPITAAIVLLSVSTHSFSPNKHTNIDSSQRRPQLFERTLRTNPFESSKTRLELYAGDRDDAAPLALSMQDLSRLKSLQKRQMKNVPVMVLDSLLPNQVLTFSSSDSAFLQLLDCDSEFVGIVGKHPTTGKALCHGVLAKLEKLSNPTFKSNDSSAFTVQVKAVHRMQIQGEPRNTGPYSVGSCEIADGRSELMTMKESRECRKLATSLAYLLHEWIELQIVAEVASKETLAARERTLGGFPSEEDDNGTSLAMFAAAMLNPVPGNGEFLDIRPAMLTCLTPHQRLLLAVTAIQANIDGIMKNQRDSRTS